MNTDPTTKTTKFSIPRTAALALSGAAFLFAGTACGDNPDRVNDVSENPTTNEDRPNNFAEQNAGQVANEQPVAPHAAEGVRHGPAPTDPTLASNDHGGRAAMPPPQEVPARSGAEGSPSGEEDLIEQGSQDSQIAARNSGELEHQIKQHLRRALDLSREELERIEVEVDNNGVTLSGSAPSEPTKAQIEEEVRRVEGVTIVRNRL